MKLPPSIPGLINDHRKQVLLAHAFLHRKHANLLLSHQPKGLQMNIRAVHMSCLMLDPCEPKPSTMLDMMLVYIF